jgi:hypothetical protein
MNKSFVPRSNLIKGDKKVLDKAQNDNEVVTAPGDRGEGKQDWTYDAEATQRYTYEVEVDNEIFDTVHVFGPLSDTRYVQWITDFNVKSVKGEVTQDTEEASLKLWADLVTVENVEDGAGIEDDEKIKALGDFLAVVADSEAKKSTGMRPAKTGASQQRVTTSAYFDGKEAEQTHVLQPKDDEWKKKYDRIQKRRFKEEATKGLSRKPNVEFVSQDEAIGELYDEMFISAKGFRNGIVPLRFKTTVIHSIFESKINPKK